MNIPLGDLEITSGHLVSLALVILSLFLLLILTAQTRTGRRPRVRSLRAFERLPAELGHSAESGAPLHFSLGSGKIGGDHTLTSLAALEVLEELADAAVAYGTPPIVTVGDPTLLPLAEDTIRRAYARQGILEQYSPTTVQFVAAQPTTYAAGAAEVTHHDQVCGNIIIGSFDEQISLLAHAGEAQALSQMIAVDHPRALGALFPIDAPLAVGEELYGGAARLSSAPRYLASLRVQDILRFLLLAAILIKATGILD